ncbi:copper amine oxidase [Rufibacter immobilis]|uniref:Copper amine oxidase n=1 Tax=Rufibacter immobilis TaxID=1348778 RepID=A0A3M9MWK7_9BACT|nr:copper amine oxidase [Rufibacter immobilis]RNI29941.1 copper amine oxidase [Rufibacter immobilis]
MKKVSKLLFMLCVSGYVQAQSLEPKLNQAILQSKQGAVVELPGFLKQNFRSIEYQKIVQPGPQFLISDDPEYIRVPEAIAFQEPVQPGAVRLYVYNVNGVKEPQKIDRKITTVIKNTGTADMHLRMLKYSSQKPTTNYFLAGKQGLADFFAAQPEKKIRTIKPGQVVAIDEQLEKNVVKYDELVHGFYEFVIDQPGQVSVIQTDLKTSGPAALARIKEILPPKGHSGAGRGVFGVSNYRVITEGVLDTKNGPAEIIMADGKKDPWVKGHESTRDQVATLAGNYGVMYEVEMKWKSSDGKGLALVTWNSRADDNQWCGGMAATMVMSKGKFDAGIIQLPSDRLNTKKDPEAIVIQVFPPAANGEEQTIKFTYSPPGASCLPTPLIFVPVDMK